jgi:tetratricopeptide (TPR) repeat protein
MGRIQEAIQHWQEALQINPDHAKAHYNLGLAMEKAGRLQEAVAHYEQALRIKPDYADAEDALAQLQANP